jgi:uncharacterized protein (TIRG00374 family)
MPGSILARFRRQGVSNPDSESSPAEKVRTASKAYRRWGLVVLVTALFAAWLCYRWWGRGFQWEVFAASFTHLDWRWVAASAGFGLLTYYGRALRWAVMLRPLQPRPNMWNLFTATAVGFTAIVLLGRPGELVRPYLISVKERVPFSSQLAAWFLERVCDLLAVLLVFGLSLSQVRTSRANLGPGLEWVLQAGGYVAGIVAAVCLLVLIVLRQFSDQMRRRLLEALGFLSSHHFQKVERIVTAFVEGIGATKSHAAVLLLIFYTFLEWVLIILCTLALLKAYPGTSAFRLEDVLIFVGFVSFGNVVQIPGVGGGIQVACVVVLRELFGVPLELATGVAIMLWFITFVVIVPIGLFLGVKEGFNWKKLRELRKEVDL